MCGYFIWYGTVRAILEPLRNSKDIMGDYVSVWASLVYILIGVVGIVLCHVFRHKWENKILKTHSKNQFKSIALLLKQILHGLDV